MLLAILTLHVVENIPALATHFHEIVALRRPSNEKFLDKVENFLLLELEVSLIPPVRFLSKTLRCHRGIGISADQRALPLEWPSHVEQIGASCRFVSFE